MNSCNHEEASMPESTNSCNNNGSIPELNIQDIINNAPVGIFTTTPGGRFISTNMAQVRMFGYESPQELIASVTDIGAQMYADPADRKEFMGLMEKHGEVLNYECRLRRRDGTEFWGNMNVRAVRDEGGGIVAYQGFMEDITARKQAEETLRESEMRFKKLLGVVPDMVSIQNPEMDIIYSNWQSFAAVPKDHRKLHTKCYKTYRNFDDICPDCLAKSVLETRKPIHEETRLPDGTWYDIRVIPILDNGNNVEMFMEWVRDITDRKQAEEKLKSDYTLLQIAGKSAKFGGWSVDLEKDTCTWSDAVADIHEVPHGYAPPLQEGINFYAPEWRDKITKVFNDCAQKGIPYDEEMEIITSKGKRKWVRTNGRAVKDEAGRIIKVQGAFNDITEYKQAEEKLNHSHRLMKYIIEHTRSSVAVHDRNLNYIYVSQRYLDDFKIKDHNIIGKHHYEVFPDLPRKWRDVHQRALAGEVLSAEEDAFYRDDGSIDWTRWECRPWYESDGSIGGIIIYTEVITERKQREQLLTEQKELLAAIYRNAPLVMMVVNSDRRIQQVNGFAAQFADRQVEEMLGLRGGKALRCMHALDDPKGCGFGEFCQQCVIRNTVLDTLETGKTHLQIEAPYFYQGQDKKIQEMTFLASTSPIMVKGERMVLVTLQNITNRKRTAAEKEKLQAQLTQAQKMESVGRLAGGVAHDFNNMLSVILGHAEMALEQIDSGEPLFEDLQEVRKAAERSADLTRQLLTFARKQTVAPKVIDLNKTVAGMLKMLRRLIGEDIDLAWRPGRNLKPVKIDPSQIDQILANLCVNARDAIIDVGKITIETGAVTFDEDYCATHTGFLPGDFILLAVSDNGCGMDSKTISHLFEPFFTTKKQGKGTGLGLASVYGAVKQNKGFINVYSEPGQGTTFKIYLQPHQAGIAPSAVKDTEKAAAPGSETILLVEDEPGILRMTTMMLKRMGYEVIAAKTPGEAIHLARERLSASEDAPAAGSGAIDLLMTDVVMPEMNGRDLAKNLLSIYPGIKRLFMSGYTANVIAHHGVLDEGVYFIQKPFSLSDLGAILREVLEKD